MKKAILYPLCTLVIFFSALNLRAQINYEFDFNKKWEWFELYSSQPAISNQLIKTIQELSNEWSIEEGRNLFKYLTKLDSINEILNLPKVIDTDSNASKNIWKYYAANELKYFSEPETFRGLIMAAVVITKIKKDIFPERRIFSNKNFYIKITDKIDTASHIYFNFSGATEIYNLCAANNIGDREINTIDTSEAMQVLFKKNNPYFTRDLLINFLVLSKNKSPVYEIYKLLNPFSYGGIGFAAAHMTEFRNVVLTINKQRENLKFYSINLLSQFFPKDAWLEANVFFLFGNLVDRVNKNAISTSEEYQEKLLVNLNTIGDDYEYLARYLTRRLFIYEKYNTQLDIHQYLFANEDTLIFQLMNEVYDGGISNYMAPILEDNRPLSLLEIDFFHFKATTNAILYKKKKTVVDSLLKAGFSGRFLFYTMGAQMAYTIDRTLGRTALVNALIYGPLEFFKIYIDAYEADKKQITDKFRFSEDFEEKVYAMRNKVSNKIYRVMYDMNVKYKDPTPIPGELEKMKIKYTKDKEDSFFYYLIGAQLLFDNEFYPKSFEMYAKVINELPERKNVSRRLGLAYYGKGAFTQAADMFGFYLKFSQNSEDAYLLRGKSYFMAKDYAKAKEDLEKVLLVNSFNEEAKNLLEQVKENGF